MTKLKDTRDEFLKKLEQEGSRVHIDYEDLDSDNGMAHEEGIISSSSGAFIELQGDNKYTKILKDKIRNIGVEVE